MRSGVSGVSEKCTPNGVSASSIAAMIAAGAGMVPPSPAPFTPSGLSGLTVSTWAMSQIGTSVGVALAHRGTGRLVVDVQPDGDLMFDAGALWSAAKNDIPMLIVMYNNRAYYNDWEHQIRVANFRGTPVDRAYIAQDIAGPEPDFATMAKSMGWYAEGPIEKPADIAHALRRAIAQVKAGKPALVDTVVRPR